MREVQNYICRGHLNTNIFECLPWARPVLGAENIGATIENLNVTKKAGWEIIRAQSICLETIFAQEHWFYLD